jgi:cytochrome P450
MFVYSRLAWNPDASWRDALEDFCRRSYGPAADDMLQHWTVLESAKEDWFRRREECNGYLQRALGKARTPDIRRRINRIAELWQESECQSEGDPVAPCKQ